MRSGLCTAGVRGRKSAFASPGHAEHYEVRRRCQDQQRLRPGLLPHSPLCGRADAKGLMPRRGCP
eukprot:scaffold102230_cov52-Phaeocystis_antarctica.AAC.3